MVALGRLPRCVAQKVTEVIVGVCGVSDSGVVGLMVMTPKR